jgi:hypothetical protein
MNNEIRPDSGEDNPTQFGKGRPDKIERTGVVD